MHCRAEQERRAQEAERDRLKRDLEPGWFKKYSKHRVFVTAIVSGLIIPTLMVLVSERLSRLEAEARADSLEKDFQVM